jgi:hypothetical protein
MKIDGTGRVVPSSTSKISKTGSSPSSADFSKMVEGESETSAASSVTGAQALTGVNPLLGLQEIDDVTERRAKAKKRATGLLDQLDDIRHCLLMGEMPPHQLTALQERIAREKIEVDDPRLMAVLEEIETRAAVELAKLEAARDEG